jgi:hypothetical protein
MELREKGKRRISYLKRTSITKDRTWRYLTYADAGWNIEDGDWAMDQDGTVGELGGDLDYASYYDPEDLLVLVRTDDHDGSGDHWDFDAQEHHQRYLSEHEPIRYPFPTAEKVKEEKKKERKETEIVLQGVTFRPGDRVTSISFHDERVVYEGTIQCVHPRGTASYGTEPSLCVNRDDDQNGGGCERDDHAYLCCWRVTKGFCDSPGFRLIDGKAPDFYWCPSCGASLQYPMHSDSSKDTIQCHWFWCSACGMTGFNEHTAKTPPGRIGDGAYLDNLGTMAPDPKEKKCPKRNSYLDDLLRQIFGG